MNLSRAGIAVAASRLMLAASVVLFGFAGWRMWSSPWMWWSLRPIPAIETGGGGRGVLLVVYQARDCDSHQPFIHAWKELHRPGELEVIGVPLDADNEADWARRALEDLQPPFEVRPDLAGPVSAVLAANGRLRTPTAVLLDRGGEARLMLDAPADPRTRPRLHALVADYHQLLQEVGR